MKKLLMVMLILLTGCDINLNSDNTMKINDKKGLDILEEEITLSIGESYKLTIYAPKSAEYPYSWLFKEGVECVTLNYDGIVQGICPGRAVIEIVDNLNNQDVVIINVVEDENSKPFVTNLAMYHHFYDYSDGEGETHRKFLTNGITNCDSIYVKESGSYKNLNYENYDIDYKSMIGGDTIQFSYYGYIYCTSLYPCGTLSFEGKLLNVEYIPSEIHEFTLIKEVDLDMINIGLSSETLKNFNIENWFVVSKDEKGNFIKKSLEEYDDQTTLYYSFNQGLENPHKYSFLYDFNPR